MTHNDCKNFITLDCEKGMCAITKVLLPLDGEGSGICPNFVPTEKCGNCGHFCNADKYGIGTCKGFEEENWAYATCGGVSCPKYTAV